MTNDPREARAEGLRQDADDALGDLRGLAEEVHELHQRLWQRLNSGDIPWDAGNDIAGEFGPALDDIQKRITKAEKVLKEAATLPAPGPSPDREREIREARITAGKCQWCGGEQHHSSNGACNFTFRERCARGHTERQPKCPACHDLRIAASPGPSPSVRALIQQFREFCEKNPPWEYVGVFDEEQCFFCGRLRDARRENSDPEQHEPTCLYIAALTGDQPQQVREQKQEKD